MKPVDDPQSSEAVREAVQRLVRPEVRALSAYHVPPAAGLIKLDAMESPYPWPGELAEPWGRALAGVEVNRYPDPEAAALKRLLRDVMEVPAGADLLLGNGSDELIQLLLLALGAPGRTVLAPEPTFVMYALLARALGLDYVGVPLNADDFSLDTGAMLEAVARHRPALVFLAYPNNPTGNLFDEAGIEALLAAAPGLVVLDEAYTPFAARSYLSRVLEHPRLLVLRTVSKMGLAGLRLGWLAGDPAWVHELNKLRLPYNINALTQAGAELALAHLDMIEAQTALIRQAREQLYQALAAVPGVRAWPSRANFILFRVEQGRAGAVHGSLRQQGVLIKSLDGAHPLLADCLRVTVGTAQENAAFLKALEHALG